jgi:hypothetical protein
MYLSRLGSTPANPPSSFQSLLADLHGSIEGPLHETAIAGHITKRGKELSSTTVGCIIIGARVVLVDSEAMVAWGDSAATEGKDTLQPTQPSLHR